MLLCILSSYFFSLLERQIFILFKAARTQAENKANRSKQQLFHLFLGFVYLFYCYREECKYNYLTILVQYLRVGFLGDRILIIFNNQNLEIGNFSLHKYSRAILDLENTLFIYIGPVNKNFRKPSNISCSYNLAYYIYARRYNKKSLFQIFASKIFLFFRIRLFSTSRSYKREI